MDSHVFYLSSPTISSNSRVYVATFCELMHVKECFIIADSLKHATDILYKQIPQISSFTSSDIDCGLLSLEYHHYVCY